MTPFLEIISGLIELHHMGQVDEVAFDNEPGDAIRDKMDAYWHLMTPKQIDISRQISVLFYEADKYPK